MSHIISGVKEDNSSEKYIGGKAKTLIELKRLGFNVPDFFVISSDVKDLSLYQDFIYKCFDDLNSLVAVRSSAVGEDGIVKSFAGQYKSMLNVTKGKLLNSINECLESLNTIHAAAYSKDFVVNQMAIIVQKMIVSDISGVSFSADPVRNDKTVIVIESVDGCCESLVSGAVTPKHYVVNKENIDEQDLPDNIKSVANITKEIERELGYFVDIEWAIRDGVLYVLQARPITTLKDIF